MVQPQVPQFAARISHVAQRRARVWTRHVELWMGSDTLFDEIRSGEYGAWLREYYADIGQEALAHGPLMSLDVYSRRSRRRDRDEDQAAFRADYDELVAHCPYLSKMKRMVELCSQESATWAAGNLSGGRDVRKQEFDLLLTLEPEIVATCQAIIDRAHTHVWRTLARLVVVFVSTESGHQLELRQNPSSTPPAPPQGV